MIQRDCNFSYQTSCHVFAVDLVSIPFDPFLNSRTPCSRSHAPSHEEQSAAKFSVVPLCNTLFLCYHPFSRPPLSSHLIILFQSLLLLNRLSPPLRFLCYSLPTPRVHTGSASFLCQSGVIPTRRRDKSPTSDPSVLVELRKKKGFLFSFSLQ